MKKYLDLNGLEILCSNLKALINTKVHYEYGGISVENNITQEFYIGRTKYAKMVITAVSGGTPKSLKIQCGRSSLTTRYTVGTLSGSNIKKGIEIEVFNTFVILKDAYGNVINTYYKGTLEDEIDIVFIGETSSDMIDFQYRLEV